VTDRAAHPPLHCSQASLQILLLYGKWRFENPFENLFMAESDGLLQSLIRIQRSQALVLVAAAGKIPQGSYVRQTRQESWKTRQRSYSEILNDSAVLLELRQRAHVALCSVDRTF